MKYYTTKNIDAKGAKYNVIFGERSNGKTFAVLRLGLEKYKKTGCQTALIRRWKEDFKGKRGQEMFSNLVNAGVVEDIFGSEWNTIIYYGMRWYLARVEDNEIVQKALEPFAFAFALSEMEHDKSTSYDRCDHIVFDEFISRGAYFPDEFVLFCNTLSTIIRQRDTAVIYMLGNTVNKYCPYFAEMGLSHVKQMKKGDIDVYNYGESGLSVAVEYSDSPAKNKKSDVYFAFDNPHLKMITSGEWELDIYPHCPVKFKSTDIRFIYFVVFDADILQCEIIFQKGLAFTFIHRKTTPLKDERRDLIYTTEHKPGFNYSSNILKPRNELEKKIVYFINHEKCFYSDNETGEILRNYLMWCKSVK